jgi:hypothetical protein
MGSWVGLIVGFCILEKSLASIVNRTSDRHVHSPTTKTIPDAGRNVKRKQSVKRRKISKMQQSDVYYQLLSQHVSGIIMPIFRRSKTVLLRMVYCAPNRSQVKKWRPPAQYTICSNTVFDLLKMDIMMPETC